MRLPALFLGAALPTAAEAPSSGPFFNVHDTGAQGDGLAGVTAGKCPR
jgi:hypothetical protein